ncbi:hypothetical protein J2X85_002362 [Microbacterium trichothecenolyticum]|uniref:DUF2142 domain-containing protein n=1 Tax=Microbacterium trichothecenolyticum TaxID=69370 RepID=UPI00285D40EA|nr:DUF2142 domain-containing protein [Microbacterium trichothecenolyticum]MDR7185328.1 hypothetical protein [Microbacterium trichothecenolyticum]
MIIAPLALLIALCSWALASPPGSSPDDDYHMASIWCAQGVVDSRCEEGTSATERRIPQDVVSASACYAFHPDLTATCDLDDRRLIATERGNWNGEAYPPLFYSAMSVFVGPDVSASIAAMRIANSVLFVGVLTTLAVLLPGKVRRAALWGSAITIVPLGMFLIPSVNPSSWAILSATGVWAATWGFFEQRGVRKILLGVLVVALTLLGGGARSDAAVYAAAALVAGSVLAFRRDRRFALNAILPLALLVVCAGLFLSAGQSAIVSGETSVTSPYATSTLIFLNVKALPGLWAGAFGTWGLGWLDTVLPEIVWVTALGVFVALGFHGLRAGGWRKRTALAGIAFCLIAIPMYILVHDGVVVGSGVQPRYIYPLLVILGGIAVVGFASDRLDLTRLQLLVVGLGLTVANSVALHVVLRRAVTGVDVPNFNLDGEIDWWWQLPFGPMAVWVVGSLMMALALGSALWRLWPRSAAVQTEAIEVH